MGELPTELADIFTKEKNWCDHDLAKFKMYKYKLLPEKTSMRLLKLFQLCMWNPNNVPSKPFSRPINFAEITVAMASQLKTPKLAPCLTSENDKIKPTKEWAYPNYLGDPKVIPEISNEQLEIIKEAFLATYNADPTTPSVYAAFDDWMKNIPFTVEVAIYAYIATICLRVGFKKVDSVSGYMKRHLTSSLTKHYGRHATFTCPIPLPTTEFLTKLAQEFQPSTQISSNFYATCLDVYFTEYSQPRQLQNPDFYERTAIVSNAILTATSGHGLLLVFQGCRYVTWDDVYVGYLKTLKDEGDHATSESATKLLEFRERYHPTINHFRCHISLAPGLKDVLFPWARILDTTYFKSLRPDANQALYAKLVAYLDPSHGTNWIETSAYKRIPANLINEAKTFAEEQQKKIVYTVRLGESRIPVGTNANGNPFGQKLNNTRDKLAGMQDELVKLKELLNSLKM